MSSVLRCILRLLIGMSLLAACVSGTPVRAQVPPRTLARMSINTGDGEALTRCVAPDAGERAASDVLPHARNAADVFAYARTVGGTVCGVTAQGQAFGVRAASTTKAGLVIDFGDGRVVTFCVELGDDGAATGEELLLASKLPVVIEYTGGVGGAVCKIDTVGTNFPSEACFAQCTLRPGEPCRYWSYSQLDGDRWRYSQLGLSNTTLRAGNVDGWAWGEGSVSRGAQPPLRTFAEICAAAPANPTPTHTSTPTPTHTPTPTPFYEQPSDTPLPSATVMPNPSAAPSATPQPSAAPQSSAMSATATTAPTSRPLATATPTAQLPLPTVPPIVTSTVPAPQPSVTPAPVATVERAATASTTNTPLLPPTAAPTAVEHRTRIWLPVVQHAAAATNAAARLQSLPAPAATGAPATPMPVPTATAVLTRAQTDADPTRGYPYFGGMALLLVACWATLRRGRGPEAP